MLVKVFKIFNLGILMVALFILLKNRELNTFIQNKFKEAVTPRLSSVESISLPITNLIKKDDGGTLNKATTTSIVISPKTEPQSSLEKETVYENMESGHSDTDETYKPTISPCKITMGFKIGSFDSRFGISRDDFINEIESSAQLWEDASGKNLFRYDENGSLTVNLIYDSRQAATVDIGYLALEIENTKQSAESIKAEYEREKEKYLRDGVAFNIESAAFKVKFDAYESKVQEYNRQGGAPREEYERMMVELQALQTESKLLDQKREQLMSDMDSINQKVKRYNEFVVYVNSLIRKSNSIGARKFTEGKFTPSINTIDIYQFTDRTKLRRVITHELGHVLGINHTKNVHSIMYSVNAGTSTSLSKEDLTALRDACN